MKKKKKTTQICSAEPGDQQVYPGIMSCNCKTATLILVHSDSERMYQRAPNPPDFAQPRLSRVKGRSTPARGYKFGCVCSYMAGVISHQRNDRQIGTNTPKFGPLAGDDRPLTLLKRGCANSGVGLELAECKYNPPPPGQNYYINHCWKSCSCNGPGLVTEVSAMTAKLSPPEFSM